MAKSKRKRVPKTVLKLPDLEQSKCEALPPQFASLKIDLEDPKSNWRTLDLCHLFLGTTTPNLIVLRPG